MPPAVTLQAVQVRTGSQDKIGHLVRADGELVAVLVRIDDPAHDPASLGQWFLEAGFGPCNRDGSPSFGDLNAAVAWVGAKLGAS